MKQERDFDGRFTAEAAAVIVRLAEQSVIEGMFNAKGDAVPYHKIRKIDQPNSIRFPYSVDRDIFSPRLMAFNSSPFITDIIGFQSKRDYEIFQRAFHHGEYPTEPEIRYPAFAIHPERGEIYLFTNRYQAYRLDHLGATIDRCDLHDKQQWLIVDYPMAKQFLYPKKRGLNRRYTLQAAKILQWMAANKMLSRVTLANNSDIGIAAYGFSDNRIMQPININSSYYQRDFTNTDYHHADPRDIVDILIEAEKQDFKDRFKARWRSGYPVFAKEKLSGNVYLFFNPSRAIACISDGEIEHFIKSPYQGKETDKWQPLSYEEAQAELFGDYPCPHEIGLNPDRTGFDADMGVIALQLARMKMLNGYFETEDNSYVAVPYDSAGFMSYRFIDKSRSVHPTNLLENRFTIHEQPVTHLSHEPDNMLLSKCYYLRYGDKK